MGLFEIDHFEIGKFEKRVTLEIFRFENESLRKNDRFEIVNFKNEWIWNRSFRKKGHFERWICWMCHFEIGYFETGYSDKRVTSKN